MKFVCNREILSNAIINVQRAVSEKSSLAALEGILLKSKSNNLYLSGYDLEFGINTNIDIKSQQDGEIILNAKIFSDILRKLPEDKVKITVNDNKVTKIESGNSKFSIVGISADEYPILPDINSEFNFNIDLNILRDMIKQTIFAVADKDTNPVHNGTLFEIEEDNITLVSVDGYRLALRKEKVNIKDQVKDKIKFVVPGKTLEELLKIMPANKDDEKVEFNVGKKNIIFYINGYKIISRLLEGNFLDYNSSIPKECNTRLIIKTKDIMQSLERVSLIISDRLKSPICCVLQDKKLKFSCNTALGNAKDELDVDFEGKEIEIGFNNKYFLDALKNVQTDEIRIEFSENIKPIKIMPKKGDNFIFLVLPVRLKSE